MANSKRARSAFPYMQRVVEDQYVQEQLGNALTRLREVYARASKEGGQAAEDKKLYGKVREAVSSIRNAARAIQEPPPKPKHRGRKILSFAVVGACVALLAKRNS